MYNAVAIEDFGTPVVVLANRGFVTDAHSAASSKGLPGLRVLGETVTCESTVAANIEQGVSEVMDEVIAALTKPLTLEEKNPSNPPEKLERLVFKGSYQESQPLLLSARLDRWSTDRPAHRGSRRRDAHRHRPGA